MLDEILDIIKQLGNEDSEFLLSDRPTLTTREAADVFGVSYSTFWRRLDAGRYRNIRKAKTPGGWKLDMEDVFQAAYPGANMDQIVRLMKEFRDEKRRRREKPWLYQNED